MSTTNFDPAKVAEDANRFVPTLIELPRARCDELLRDTRWGRLAIVNGGWPTIRPILYSYDGESLLFRTKHSARFSADTLTAATMEIDEADRDGAWGWSVIVEGTALDVTATLGTAAAPYPPALSRPWAPGQKDQWVRVNTDRVSGIAFGPVPWLASATPGLG